MPTLLRVQIFKVTEKEIRITFMHVLVSFLMSLISYLPVDKKDGTGHVSFLVTIFTFCHLNNF